MIDYVFSFCVEKLYVPEFTLNFYKNSCRISVCFSESGLKSALNQPEIVYSAAESLPGHQQTHCQAVTVAESPENIAAGNFFLAFFQTAHLIQQK